MANRKVFVILDAYQLPVGPVPGFGVSIDPLVRPHLLASPARIRPRQLEILRISNVAGFRVGATGFEPVTSAV